jgi:hypothetical protein
MATNYFLKSASLTIYQVKVTVPLSPMLSVIVA